MMEGMRTERVPGDVGTDRMPWDEARRRAHGAAVPVPAVALPLADAGGAVLAGPLVAPVALPPVDCSAMDGFAVCGPPPWLVVGSVRRADTATVGLAPGRAAAVVTGAPLPAGTTAVLPLEDALRDGDRLAGPATPGRHVRPAGEECAAGDRLVAAGTEVTPAVLGLAAALGHDTLCAHPVPSVAALVTGDELAAAGPPGRGRVRDAIGPMLPGLVAAAGGRWTGAVRVPDDPAALAGALDSTRADLLLVTGSSGPGPADHLRAVLAGAGARLVVDGVACRPGHPQALARTGAGRLVAGLPGNPFAALVAFLTVGAPAVAGLRGRPLPALPVVAGRDLTAHPVDHRIVPVRIRGGTAEPVGHEGAAMLRGAAVADALAVVEPGDATTVRLLPLDRGGAPWGA
jgi:molybdopterin molybdotransferase